MAFDYDLFVIGGGSGGVRAARTAAATGASVALAEEYRMGGTCVIRGCVPKKLMVYASSYPRSVEDAAAYGWKTQIGAFDWRHFRGTLHAELDRLETVYRKTLGNSDVEIFDSRARLVDAHTVTLADGSTMSARHILIATGGHPIRPDLPNAQMGMVSNDIFQMETLPESMLIVGGGYIACEFACILTGLGVKVTQYYRGAQVLRGFDDEARGLVAEMMRAQGVDLHVGTNIVEMAPASEAHPESGGGTASDAADSAPVGQSVGHGGGETRNLEVDAPFEDHGPLRVKATNGSERVFDTVLFATGRAPNTRELGLEDTGVRLGRKGEIEVDDYSQSSVPSIYAIGDVTNRLALTPVAIREGVAFTNTVFSGNPTKPDHDLVPSAIFTQPEMGTVGMTEEEAMERGGVEIYSTSFKAMQQAFAGRTDRVLMKLIVDAESRTVLGCHIVAEMAGEMIQLAGIAIKMGATKEQFDQTCAVHPTMAEELVTMKTPVRRA
ncbi:FAD-dependent oxidoreductase [Profundibacterium mesophilum]|uniref:NADPH-glutathione reductase n=1 Tax=Profundibacterium mesophilum KAUST100406-0324 TaxID=1037889 RepID=A0A921TDB0_9RHOB|nr:FAD-dependent oxidoreductase [Profundibacterium mesophilum]KAF0676141.1 NADPH-glutathione reductase [Profundibacterium mesophilum KAUST100406-0324]